MKKIKILFLCIIGLWLGLSSCNKNEEICTFIPLRVIETFSPKMKEYDFSDIHGYIPYKNNVFVVNSISDLPEDLIFGNEEFIEKDIDFSKYSLIVFYDLRLGKILSAKYSWSYNTDFDQYQVRIRYEIEKDSYLEGDKELATYVRSAMLVDKIPYQSYIGQWIGVHWTDSK